jgi:copper resistance protein C
MKIPPIAISLALVLFVAVASAHAHLEKSTPPEGAVIAAMPAGIVLYFSEAAHLTGIWIQNGASVKHKLAADSSRLARQFSVTVPNLGSGAYTLGWRAVAADGHIMPGQLHFVVAAPQPAR